MKKRIFIGSSIEAKDLALQIQRELQSDFECILWYEDFFTLGNHYYTDLVRRIITFDYAIMIGAEDDFVTRISNKAEKKSPRDNVYLEYGLFSGILSPKRVFLLLHKNCKPATDLSGMSLGQYENIQEAIECAKNWLYHIDSGIKSSSIGRKDVEILPTVGTAVGYYYNFVKPFTEKLLAQDDSSGYQNIKLNICIPDFLSDNVSYYENNLIRRLHLKRDNICNFRILVEEKDADTLSMYDVPNTLLALFKTVNYVFEISDGNTEDTIYAKIRALNNFYDNLSILINNDLTVKEMVNLIRYSEKGPIGFPQ